MVSFSPVPNDTEVFQVVERWLTPIVVDSDVIVVPSSFNLALILTPHFTFLHYIKDKKNNYLCIKIFIMIPLDQKIQTISPNVDVTERRSKLLNDRSEYYTIEELKSSVATTDESEIFSPLSQTIIVSDSYTFDIDSARRFLIRITEDTTLTVPTLPVSTAVVFTVDMTGDFALTIADSTVTPTSDTYDGTISNRLTFDCYRAEVGVQVNIVTIENIG